MASHFRKTRGRVLVVGGLTALLAVALIGSQISSSSAAPGGKTKTETVTINLEGGHRLFFDAPKSVHNGDILKILNLTSGKQIGPHSFSLVKPGLRPDTKPERKKCFAPGHICLAIARWHTGGNPMGPLKFNPAKAGAAGWDTEGSLSTKGDSWFSGGKKGNSFQQVVSAKAGSTIHFMCLIHPNMQGEIQVLP